MDIQQLERLSIQEQGEQWHILRYYGSMLDYIETMREQGVNSHGIASRLNSHGLETRHGFRFSGEAISSLLDLYDSLKPAYDRHCRGLEKAI